MNKAVPVPCPHCNQLLAVELGLPDAPPLSMCSVCEGVSIEEGSGLRKATPEEIELILDEWQNHAVSEIGSAHDKRIVLMVKIGQGKTSAGIAASRSRSTDLLRSAHCISVPKSSHRTKDR